MSAAPASAGRPAVSVVLPVRNGGGGLHDAVTSVLAQEINGGLELVVVDNGSTDGAVDALRTLAASDPRLRLVSEPVRGSYAARNRGWRESNGPVVAFLDADCRALPGWLEHGIVAVREQGVGIAGGGVLNQGGGSWVGRIETAREPLGQHQTLRDPYLPYVVTANAFIRREVLDALGGFDSSMLSGGDADLCWRAQAAGWRVTVADDAVVVHHNRDSLAGVARQHRSYGRGMAALERRHPGCARSAVLTPPRALLGVARRALVAAAKEAVRRDGRGRHHGPVYVLTTQLAQWSGYLQARRTRAARR